MVLRKPPIWRARDYPIVWFLLSDLPSMTESAREIELPAGIAVGIMKTHKLPYHYKGTVLEGSL